MRPKHVLPLLAFLLSGAAVAAQLGEPVELRVGETAAVAELEITFIDVDADNRCPRNVQCIVAGRARVRLAVVDGEGRETQLHVDVPPGGEGKGRTHGYELTVAVAPEPAAGEPIAADAYVVTLVFANGGDASDAPSAPSEHAGRFEAG